MSPTLRNEPVALNHDLDLDVVHRSRTRRPVRLYACALLAGALAVVVGLAINGEAFPLPGPMLLLAIPLALCMNRFVFFPNEIGVTADAAVVFAAMVAFHGDATWLGPLLIALLVGPLDAKHWGERAFVRMAYNSGSTALVTLAALVAFVALVDVLGTSWWGLSAAAAGAAIPYVLVESVFGIVLVVLLGERVGAATRHQLPLNCIALPLAILGAGAGLAAADVAWWIAFVLLLPVPILPELMVMSLPRHRVRMTNTTRGAVLLGACVALLTLGLVLPGALLPILVDVAAVACFVGAECGSVASLRRNALWLTPFLAVAVCLAIGWTMAGRMGALLFVVGLFACVSGASAWGPLPWSSRIVVPLVAPHLRALRRPTLLVCSTAAIVVVVLAIRASTNNEQRTALALTSCGLLETAVTMAAVAVRMWRFAPRRRRIDATILAVIGVTALVTCLTPVLYNTALLVVIVAAGMIAVSCVAWPLVLGDSTRSQNPRAN